MRSSLFAVVALLAACASLAPAPLLRWSRDLSETAVVGHVALGEVVNKRPADHGGKDLNWVGVIRDWSGTPNAVRTDNRQRTTEPLDVDVSLGRFTGDALRTAGFEVAAPDDKTATAKIGIEVRDFYADCRLESCSGAVSIDFVVSDPVSGTERARVPVSADIADWKHDPNCDAWSAYYYSERMCAVLDPALSSAQRDLASAFRRPAIQDALLGKIESPGGAPTAPAEHGCGKDSDCKGDRICVHAECVNP